MTWEVIDGPPSSRHRPIRTAKRCKPRTTRHEDHTRSDSMPTFQPSTLLRQALLADAVTSGACGVLMLAGASLLEGMLGLPGTLLRGAGAALIPYAGLLAYLSTRDELQRVVVWAV